MLKTITVNELNRILEKTLNCSNIIIESVDVASACNQHNSKNITIGIAGVLNIHFTTKEN
jgi:hypothetical protein